MEKQHLTYFKIKNFKRFDSFEMSNLGQFNLIVGDNNVGKTSVLEALTFDSSIFKLAINYFNIINFRGSYNFKRYPLTYQDIQQTNFWLSVFKVMGNEIVIEIKGFELNKLVIETKANIDLDNEEREMARGLTIGVNPNNWLVVTSYYAGAELKQVMPSYFEGVYTDVDNTMRAYTPFIPANISYSKDMLQFYYDYFNSDKVLRKQLEKNIQLLIPNIEEIRPHKISDLQEVIGVNTTDSNEIRPLSFFGDGVSRLARICLEVIISENRRLMIDEIGTGIHFSKLKDFWKLVIQTHHKYQVQLFATTHSLECQQAFVEALQDEDMQQFQKDARNITMIEDKEGQVKAITYDYEQFDYALNIGFNTRGGKI